MRNMYSFSKGNNVVIRKGVSVFSVPVAAVECFMDAGYPTELQQDEDASSPVV